MKKLMNPLKWLSSLTGIGKVPETVSSNIKDYRKSKTKRMLITLTVFVILAILTAMGKIPYEVLVQYIPFL